jgi:hypothetical protein
MSRGSGGARPNREIPFGEIVGHDATSKKLIISEYIVDPEKGPTPGNGFELHVKL